MNPMQMSPEPQRRSLPVRPMPGEGGGEGPGPKRPDIQRPDTQRILERMRRVDPEQSKRYRQRTGE